MTVDDEHRLVDVTCSKCGDTFMAGKVPEDDDTPHIDACPYCDTSNRIPKDAPPGSGSGSRRTMERLIAFGLKYPPADMLNPKDLKS